MWPIDFEEPKNLQRPNWSKFGEEIISLHKNAGAWQRTLQTSHPLRSNYEALLLLILLLDDPSISPLQSAFSVLPLQGTAPFCYPCCTKWYQYPQPRESGVRKVERARGRFQSSQEFEGPRIKFLLKPVLLLNQHWSQILVDDAICNADVNKILL